MELTKIKGGFIYFDANIFIYAIEGTENYKDKIRALFSRIEQTKTTVVTSELTLVECLVKPYNENDDASVLIYEKQIKNSDFLKVMPLPLSLLKQSAQLRAKYKNKLADSIHLATAINHGCDVFVTNDIKLKIPNNIERLLLKNIE